MTVGTKSLLFGVHQFFLHPLFVWLGWKSLYGVFPSFAETVCIIVHDWGYWGKTSMDDEDGRMHPVYGACLAGKLFRRSDRKIALMRLCLFHSRHLAEDLGCAPSRLCWADKFSLSWEPAWLYLLRARLSGELAEYRQQAEKYGELGLEFSDLTWFRWIRARCMRLANDAVWETVTEVEQRLVKRKVCRI